MFKENDRSALMATYARFPITILKGKGTYVWNEKNEAYLDFTSGIATCNLGHVPDQVTQKLHQQLDTLWHCSNLYGIPSQTKLAEGLIQHSIFDQAFFCNSGAEANEAALKIARKYAKDHGHPERTSVVSFKNSFHGRTYATLSVTGQEKVQIGYEPLMPGVRSLLFNEITDLGKIHNGKTAAVLLELVQGEGGVNPAQKEWLHSLQDICNKHDILLMVDEIQTGMGRTGTLFAYEQYGIEPDVMTLAKGLGSGFPIGAMLAKKHIAASFTPGTHGTTFGGNPLAATAGMATLTEMTKPGFMKDVRQKADYFKEQLERLARQFSVIKKVKGLGFLMGIEVDMEAIKLVTLLQEQHVLTLTAGKKVLRILPPLTVTIEEINEFIQKLENVLLVIQEKDDLE
ncbi:acetylornithine transaminase [Carnobacterium sp. ISL-102]|uniref:acetylornithine transaminase n=1 Tax=Carnobacterium sp. ISL-102 TaxID=2819142 RepID=UPI001BED383D|nr:acetylornithine transaminase [Carnobacterium sp. ISL-102]MBT2732190.1 acetylornithine transaminase [Carnobacterium sp. ISL-102]